MKRNCMLALLVLASVGITNVRAEIPGLTPMERAALERGAQSDQVPADAGPIHFVAPGVRVREFQPEGPAVALKTQDEVRRYLESTRPSHIAVLQNGGFEAGDFSGWTLEGALGSFTPSACGQPWPADAFITDPGLMPFANNDPLINFVKDQQHSAQLGDDLAWGFAQATEPKCSSIRQDAVIPAGKTHFVFWYAVLASNPGHGWGQDPYFQVKVEDLTAGVPLYDVIDYTTSYDANSPCNPWCLGAYDPRGGNDCVYRRWERVDLNLSGRAGHTVRLSLLASDCSPNAHFCETFLDEVVLACEDSIPPPAVQLTAACAEDVANPGTFCATLHWTAPADSSSVPDSAQVNCVPIVKAAEAYDIRWSTSPIVTDADFAAANPVPGQPAPGVPGSAETFQFCGLPAGIVYIALRSHDAFNESPFAVDSTNCTLNEDPDCSAAAASISELWPPNHQMVPVSVVGVTDPDGDPITIAVNSVTQDEPLNTYGDGNTCPDAIVDGNGLRLRAERTGSKAVPGNGRVYVVHFTASDGRGGSCDDSVSVCVPHDQRRGHVCVDDGQKYVSTGPCGPAPRRGGQLGVQYVRGRSTGATFEYSLERDGHVNLSVFDVAGRRVVSVVNGRQPAGTHTAQWSTVGLPSGIYWARIRTLEYTDAKKLIVQN